MHVKILTLPRFRLLFRQFFPSFAADIKTQALRNITQRLSLWRIDDKYYHLDFSKAVIVFLNLKKKKQLDEGNLMYTEKQPCKINNTTNNFFLGRRFIRNRI